MKHRAVMGMYLIKGAGMGSHSSETGITLNASPYDVHTGSIQSGNLRPPGQQRLLGSNMCLTLDRRTLHLSTRWRLTTRPSCP